MVRDNDCIAIFHSIHRVMKAEKILKGQHVDILLIPAPRQLSSDCGLALRFAESDAARILQLLADQQLVPAELYRFQGDQFIRQEIFP